MNDLSGRIRLARPDDAEAIAEIYAPIVQDTSISFEVVPPGAHEMRSRIEKTLAVFPWLALELNSRVMGYAYAGRHRERAAYQWSVDVSCYVHAEMRGRGVGKRLYAELLRLLKAQGFFNAFAGITLPNAASVGLHESIGFERIATYHQVGFKMGAWHDTGWWQLRLNPNTEPPAPPRALRELGAEIVNLA